MDSFNPTQKDLYQLKLPLMILAKKEDEEFFNAGFNLAALLTREGNIGSQA